MKSKPITRRAATKYGSAPKNQEVTIDAEGKNPAKFERMSPIKLNGTPSAGSLVNVGGQAAKAGTPRIERFYTGGNEMLIKGAGGKSLRQAYDDALKLGWREESESFEDYVKRAKQDPNYGKGGTPDRIESTPGYTTEIISQEATPIEETRDTYKPWEQRQAARAQKVAGRLYRQAERRFAKGKITEQERDAAKARLDAATGAAMAGRNVMQSSTYTAPKSGKGLPEFDGGPRINVTLDPINLTANPANLRETTAAGREKVSVADTGLSSSTPDAFRQARGTNPLEEKQPGISKKNASSPIYKMGGWGSKAYKK